MKSRTKGYRITVKKERSKVNMDTMTTRERFQAVMNFEPFDRLPIIEWAHWWDKTLERWYQEGLDKSITDRYDLYTHFGQDMYYQYWFPSRKAGCPRPTSHGAGILSTMDDYEKIRDYLFPWPVVDKEKWENWAKLQEEGDAVIWFTIPGFFWFARTLFGIEPHLYAFYDEPELMHRINSDLAEWMIKIVDELSTVCRPDFMTFAEDMSYNHGPMLSKDLFDEFMKPYYEMINPRLKKYGTIPIIDSDGDISVPASWFSDAGIEGILPLERQAGVDVAKIREAHPKMKFIGCFDKMTMNKGEKAMREEFERLLPVASRGGLIVGCDHQTPPGVSYEDYQLYLRLFREYGQEAGRQSQIYLGKGK